MTKKLFLSTIALIMLLSFVNFTKAENAKLYVSDDNVYYDCPGGAIQAPANLNIDIESVIIIDNRFFKDASNVYVATTDAHSQVCSFYKITDADPSTFVVFNDYYQKDKNNAYKSDNYWGWGTPRKIDEADAGSFQVLSNSYAMDNNRAYHAFDTSLTLIENIDINSFEVLNEDNSYAMDKNTIYFQGKIVGDNEISIKDNNLYNSLKGKIILKVEQNGEAYYVHPSTKKMYFLSRPIIAFKVMREQGVGITDKDLEKIEIAMDNLSGTDTDGDGLPDMVEDSLGTDINNIDSDGDGFSDKDELLNGYNPTNSGKLNIDNSFAKNQIGKIFLQVEKNGEAWYVNPVNNKRYFLGRPTDAFNVMRELGLGISDINYKKMTVGNDNYSVYENQEFGISFQYSKELGEIIEENKLLKFSNTDKVKFEINTKNDVELLMENEEKRLASCSEEDCGPRKNYILNIDLWQNELDKISNKDDCDSNCAIIESNNAKILSTYYTEWPGNYHKRYTLYSREYRIDILIINENMYSDLNKFQEMEKTNEIFQNLNKVIESIELIN